MKSDYRLCERKKKKNSRFIWIEQTRQQKFHVCHRETKWNSRKITREISKSKGQLYLIEFRVLLPVDFHFDSILHLISFFTIFSQDKIPSLWRRLEILRNSMQNRFSIFDNIFPFPIVTSIKNEIHQTKIHRKSLITAPPLSPF